MDKSKVVIYLKGIITILYELLFLFFIICGITACVLVFTEMNTPNLYHSWVVFAVGIMVTVVGTLVMFYVFFKNKVIFEKSRFRNEFNNKRVL